MTGLPRPASVSRSALVSGVIGLALVLVANTTGAGWIMVLVSGLAAVLVIAAFLPAVALVRPRVECSAPRDGIVARPLLLPLRVLNRTAAMKVRGMDPPGDWAAVEGPADGDLVLTPERRGVFSELRFELQCGAPLGLFWWKRRVVVALDRPLEVGPRPIDIPLPALLATAVGGERDRRTTAAPDDLVRSVRDYTRGDPIKLVHWPASARAGDLVVKELEAPDRPAVAIVVDLSGDGRTVEDRASRAAGLALAALRGGYRVTLLTADAGGPRVAAVEFPVDVSRRLARATRARPPEGPVPAGATVVRAS